MEATEGSTFILINPRGEMLLQLRDAISPRYPNTWCFPGETLNEGELPIQAVVRGVKEEYNLDVDQESCEELMLHQLPYGPIAQVFLCKIGSGQAPELREGAAMEWVGLERIKSMNLGFGQDAIIPVLEEALSHKSLI